MSDETALLRAIASHPDEDTPRLAYADWLEEHGNSARAAFIRGQIELAGLNEDSMHRREVAFRCRQLLDAHEEEWLEPREAFELDWGWSRGFVETYSTTPPELDTYAELFAKYPFRRLWLWELDGDIDGVHLIPAANKLTALDLIGNNLNVNQLKKLAKMKHLSHLRELGLMFNALRDTAVKVLCGEPFFQKLDLIRLGANPFADSGRDQLRTHFGNRVTFSHDREPERLYTIQDDYLRVGWGKDHTQLFISATERGPEIAFFDHAGNLLRIEERAVEYPSGVDYTARERIRTAARDKWLEELGYQSATIKVKRFQFADGGGITPFNWWAEAYDDQITRAAMEEAVVGWLTEGQYRFNLVGRDRWFDRSGEMTDT